MGDGGRIVVVEDDAVLAEVFGRVLARGGHEVEVASSAAEGLIRSRNADLLVVDATLSGALSGLELVRKVRTESATEVIVITGHGSMELAVSSLRAGASDFLLKPVENVTLLHSVERALERQRLRAQASVAASARELFGRYEASALTQRFAEWAAGLTRSDQASLLVADDAGHLELVSRHGLPADAERFAPTSGLAARVSASGAPVVLQGESSGDRRFAEVPSRPEVSSSILWPLKGQGQLTAMLCLARRASSPPFRDRDLVVVEAIAQQGRLALEIHQMARRAAAIERLAAMGELSAGVAHEINNPLAFVRSNLKFVEDCLLEMLGTIALLNEGKPKQALEAWDAAGGPGLYSEVQFALDEAVQGADRISTLIRDMRHVTRQQPGPTEAFPLIEAVESAVRLAGAELKASSLRVEVPRGLLVQTELGRLSQAILNLLVNAAQAMEKSAIRELHVRGRAEGGSVLLEIRDTGTGVPPELGRKIFEPFFTTKRPGKGTGLGLPIALQMVQAAGGELTYRNNEGGGTTFLVRLPAVMPERADR